jgi:hypothetical protein
MKEQAWFLYTGPKSARAGVMAVLLSTFTHLFYPQLCNLETLPGGRGFSSYSMDCIFTPSGNGD